MRLPLVPLSEWVLNRQNEFELKLFESFRQEFNIRDNEEFSICERYGSYDGQMKQCCQKTYKAILIWMILDIT